MNHRDKSEPPGCYITSQRRRLHVDDFMMDEDLSDLVMDRSEMEQDMGQDKNCWLRGLEGNILMQKETC